MAAPDSNARFQSIDSSLTDLAEKKSGKVNNKTAYHTANELATAVGSYDNTTSGLTATTIQAAIDENAAAISGVDGYSVYVARIFQTGTSAPVATVLKNTLSSTPVWSRSGPGDYYLTLASEFVEDKTWIVGANENSSQTVVGYWNDANSIGLFTDAGTDGNVQFNIEIRVYS